MGHKKDKTTILCVECSRILYPDVEYDDMGYNLSSGVKCSRCGQETIVYTYDEYEKLKK